MTEVYFFAMNARYADEEDQQYWAVAPTILQIIFLLTAIMINLRNW